jgi:hypothetical protein
MIGILAPRTKSAHPKTIFFLYTVTPDSERFGPLLRDLYQLFQGIISTIFNAETETETPVRCSDSLKTMRSSMADF